MLSSLSPMNIINTGNLTILFKGQLIGTISSIDLDSDRWYSGYISLSEYGESKIDFFDYCVNEENYKLDISVFDPDLFEDIYWQIEAGGKLIQIHFPAIYSGDRLIMWRTSESESEPDIKYFLMQHQSQI
jgi:hypothetical protein